MLGVHTCLCVFYGFGLRNVKAVLIWNPDVSGFLCPSAFIVFRLIFGGSPYFSVFQSLKIDNLQVLNGSVGIVLVQSGFEVYKSSH